MKRLACFTFGVLFVGVLASCCATPTAVHMIKPGDQIGDMVVTNGQWDSATEIWLFCDPFVTEPGVFTRE